MGLVFGMALLLQVAHFAEHVAQIYQKNVQHVKTPPHGLLGVWLDVEWAHFIYNVGLGLAIVMMFVGYRMWRKEWRQYNVVAWVALVAAMVVQAGWHVSEHAVKMYQYYAHGWNPAPGILGHTPKFGTGPFQVVYLHFWYNLAVTALLVVPTSDTGPIGRPSSLRKVGGPDAAHRDDRTAGPGHRALRSL